MTGGNNWLADTACRMAPAESLLNDWWKMIPSEV